MTQLSIAFSTMALRLVELFGKDGYIIRRKVLDESEEVTPTKPGVVTITDYVCKAAITDFKVEEIDGTNVLRGDKQVVVAVTNTLPEQIIPGDYFVDFDNTEWTIVPKAQPLEVNGIKVAYIIQVRM